MKILIAVPTFENILPDTFKSIYNLKKTENMIVDFSKTHNIKVNKESRVKIINNIMQQKANELSKSMMADLKKYYFVDIKGWFFITHYIPFLVFFLQKSLNSRLKT